MMKGIKWILVWGITFWVIAFGRASAQDPQFTQFFANPIYIAPSYAGASAGQRIILSYRDQWSVIPNTYRTMSASYDINLESLRSGLGVFALGDLAGDGRLGTIIGGLNYSYSIPLNSQLNLRPGIGFFFRHHSLNYDRLIWGDQLVNTPRSATTMQSIGKNAVYDIDISTSVLLHSADLWVGATWDHMLRPKMSFYSENARVPFRFSIFGGYRFIIKSLYRRGIDQSLSVAANARLQGRFSQAEIGGYWLKNPLMLGVWYRGIPLVKDYAGSDALAFMLGLRFTQVQVVYTYDLTVSKLGPGSGGSHEISLAYEMPLFQRRRRYKPLLCPPY